MISQNEKDFLEFLRNTHNAMNCIERHLIEIRDFLYTNFRGTIIQEPKQERVQTSPFPPQTSEYDWWRTRDGNYAKVLKANLNGEIYDQSGKPIREGHWNPYSLKDIKESTGDLENHRSGEAKGWPEWTK